MGVSDRAQSQLSLETSTVVVVKNRCQFCYAFFKDTKKIAEHSNRCLFRFSESFEASDGRVKFACAVCFDVFPTKEEHTNHVLLHRFPGGFPCSICDKIFLNEFESDQHMESVHKIFGVTSMCFDCGAFFEQESYLRLHAEINCDGCQSSPLTEDTIYERVQIEDQTTIGEITIAKNEYSLGESEIQQPTENESNPSIACAGAKSRLQTGTHEEKDVGEDAENTKSCVNVDTDNQFSREDASTGGESIAEASTSIGRNDESSDSDSGSDGPTTPTDEPEEKFKCKFCRMKYSSARSYYNHINVHGPDGSLVYKCDGCRTYFKSKTEQREHARSEHKERLTCKYCNKLFSRIDSVYSHQLDHLRKVKKKERRFYCIKCGKLFKDRTILDAHERSDCERAPPCKCDVCGKSFVTKYRLKSHQLSHGERSFECVICKARFKTKLTLQKHAITHATDKPFQCQHCNKKFADMDYLKVHMNLHAVGRYVCYCCGNRYPTNSALHKHRNARKNTCALVPIQPPLKISSDHAKA